MKIRDILRSKGADVVTIGEDRSVHDAVKTLCEHNIGGLVVTEGGRPIGIITERDVLRLASTADGQLASTPVGSVMTRDLITATPDGELHDMMGLMTDHRIRHLPIIEDDRLAGIVSIGDLVNACHTLAEQENSQLRRYIQGAT